MQRLGLLITVLFATSAHAFNAQNARVASDLGSLLASEELCDLSFNHDAIDAYIDEHVDHSDMGFASSLTGQITVSAFSLRDMSESAKRAHCRAIAATARAHDLID